MSQEIIVTVVGGKNTSKPIFLPTLPLSVERNQTAILQLPDLGSEISFKITSKKKLTAEIIGNQLIMGASNVISGIYILTINIVPESADFKVKVEVFTK
jgi:hypothetical protein